MATFQEWLTANKKTTPKPKKKIDMSTKKFQKSNKSMSGLMKAAKAVKVKRPTPSLNKRMLTTPTSMYAPTSKQYQGANFMGKAPKSGPYAPGKNRKSY